MGDLIIRSDGSPYTFDTDTGRLFDAAGMVVAIDSVVLDGQAPVRAITATNVRIELASTLWVRGSMPLIIASWSDVDVAGTLDASSRAAQRGAGANAPACAEHAAQAGIPTGGRGDGGGGGGFSAPGGNGGFATGSSAAGGTAVPVPTFLRGGCPGGDGADGDGIPQTRGIGGAGGGAVHLYARGEIIVSGTIHAGGAGGGGGLSGHGGGGGGTGYIVIATDNLLMDATVIISPPPIEQ